MKKILSSFVIMLLCLCLCLSLFSCGDGTYNDDRYDDPDNGYTDDGNDHYGDDSGDDSADDGNDNPGNGSTGNNGGNTGNTGDSGNSCNHMASSDYSIENVTKGNCMTPGSFDKVYFCMLCGDIAYTEKAYTDGDDHVFDADSCTLCNAPKPSENVEYTISGNHAEAVGLTSDFADDTLIIADRYDGFKVTKIKKSAFLRGSFSSVVIPESVSVIESEAFCACPNLSSVTIPDSVTAIDNNAFASCDSLKSVKLSKNIKSFGREVFAYNSTLEHIVIPDGLSVLGVSTFTYCNSLKSVTIPGSIKLIPYNVFSDCQKLESVTIGEGVEQIDAGAFSYCASLTDINFPSSLSIINENFNGCTSLPQTKYDNALYLGTASNPYVLLVKASYNRISSCVIHPDTLFISSGAFASTDIQSITVPDGVLAIGDQAFSFCPFLSTVVIGNGVKVIPAYLFYGTFYVKSLTLGSSVERIEENACSDIAISELVIPDGVTYIGDNAFNGCSALTSISLPDSLEFVGTGAFNLDNDDQTVYNIYDNAMYLGNASNPYVYLYKSTGYAIDSCDIHPDTKVIGSSAFAYCNQGSFTEITVPSGVKMLGTDAFISSSSLVNVTLPDSLMYIGSSCFAGCYSLKNLTLPENLKYIGDRAFYACYSITEIVIHDGIEYLGASAFEDCTKLTSAKIGEGITEIFDQTFKKTDLTEIYLPSTLTRVNDEAFSLTELETVYFGGSSKQWYNIEISDQYNAALKHADIVCES